MSILREANFAPVSPLRVLTFFVRLKMLPIERNKIDSRDIADLLGVRHRDMARDCILDKIEIFSSMGGLCEYKDKPQLGGRPSKYYKLTITQALFLVSIMKNTEKTIALKSMLAEKSADLAVFFESIKDIELPDDLPDMYVYMIKEPSTGNIKIGISQDPERRLRQLQTGNSSKLELVACAKAENRYEDEMNLHRMVENMLVRGEWFATGNAYAKELHKKLEEVGKPDAIEVAARKSGCLAQVIIFDDAVYAYSPSMIEKYPDLEAYLNGFDSEAIAEDLGCDINEVGCPLEYSIDLREAKARVLAVVPVLEGVK